MSHESSDGNCPQCELAGKVSTMRLNGDDYWECPDCHLQTAGTEHVRILTKRGTGDFSAKGTTAGSFTSNAPVHGHDGRSFKGAGDLAKYIETEVSKQ